MSNTSTQSGIGVSDGDLDEFGPILDAYGFDPAGFARLREQVASGTLSPAGNVVTGVIEPPAAEDLVPLPEPGDSRYEQARAAGLAALEAGAVASAVLNGGMATRFGGRVKGIVPAVDDRSFLELKLGQVADLAAELGAAVPCAVMTSFATDAPTRQFLAGLSDRNKRAGRAFGQPLFFSQYVSLRLQPDGELFRTADGRLSPYAPGHGDFLAALRNSGTLQRLRSLGVRHLMVSNVDNLLARVDPAVIGMHLLSGRPMTAEVTPNQGDVGGAPARVDGHPMLLESMRFPAGFDHRTLPVTNVNTVTFDLAALDREFALTWLYIEKMVEGRTAVQLEHLIHEASAFLPTTYLEVPVTGPRARVLPVKTPDDLAAGQDRLREVLARPALD
jgi:UTP--glucose-1-phosphate uridylyltransferase